MKFPSLRARFDSVPDDPLSPEPCRSDSRPRVGFPLWALALASGLGLALLTAQVVFTVSLRHGYLAWNLFLAWLPVVFALALWRRHERDDVRSWQFLVLAWLWLLFLPNAPYLCTDFKHLKFPGTTGFWTELVLILWFAWIGMLLGFVALHLVHVLVQERCGRRAGWGLAGGAAALSGIGIALGRFLRRNSWDAAVSPLRTAEDLLQVITTPKFIGFSLLFGFFFLVSYITLHALIHLRPAPPAVGPGRARAGDPAVVTAGSV